MKSQAQWTLLCYGISSEVTGLLYHSTTDLSRTQATQLLDDVLLPKAEWGERLALDRPTATDDDSGYGEFPLQSLDVLLDEAIVDEGEDEAVYNVVDLGSGCGRLALYMALSRPNWHVHGIERELSLHRRAEEAAELAVTKGYLTINQPGSKQGKKTFGQLSLHLGEAAELRTLLEKADLIFCYSTAFRSERFSPEVGAMILASEWQLLLSSCKQNCVCITTEKALDPCDWDIESRHTVPNPEVLESTGFIHVKRQ